MKLDNPKLTAFALDELDPVERAEIEALLDQHPEVLEEINNTIEVSSLVRDVLQSEKAEGFTEGQREAILNHTAVLTADEVADLDEQKINAGPFVIVTSSSWEKHLYLQAIAACLMVGVGLYFLYVGSNPKSESKPELARMAKLAPATLLPLTEPGNRPGEIAVRLLEEEEIVTDTVASNEEPRYAALPEEGALDAFATTKELPPVLDDPKSRPLVPAITIDSTPPFTSPAPAPLSPQPLQIAKQAPNPEPRNKSLRILPASAARKLITAIPTRDNTIKPGDGKLDAIAPRGKIISDPSEVPLVKAAHHIPHPALIQKGLLARDNSQFVRVADAPLSLAEVNFNHVHFADLKSRLSRESKNLPTIAELTNSFHYTPTYPDAGQPFGMTLEVASCPWEPRHRLVLVVVQTSEVSSEMLETARKVGLQVDFNPLEAVAYRLIGQNTAISLGSSSLGAPRANTAVVALYEVIPAEQPVPEEGFQQSKYLPWNTLARKVAGRLPSGVQQELLTATLQYQRGNDTAKHTIENPLLDEGKSWADASAGFRWVASVAGFGMALHQSTNAERLDMGVIKKMAQEANEGQKDRAEFLLLMESLLARP